MDDKQLLTMCRVDCFRGSGPGGQHRNTTDSSVRLTLNGVGISVVCDRFRSQTTNRMAALAKLRFEIALAIRQSPLRPWPGPWRVSKKNPQYPAIVATVLDALNDNDWRIGQAAKLTGTTSGVLKRVLLSNRKLWQLVNDRRLERGLKTLRI